MNKILKTALVLGLGSITGANAAGTAAGTAINNVATLDFNVGGVPQLQQNSVPDASLTADFVVDRKVNMTLLHQDAAAVIEAPGNDVAMKFTLTNTGNDTQDYGFATFLNDGNPFAVVDSTDPVAASTFVFVDDGDGLWDPLLDTATYVDQLAPDASIDVWLVQTIEAADATGLFSETTLVATAQVGDTPGAQGANEADESAVVDDAATVNVVYADVVDPGYTGLNDAANDGTVADFTAYETLIPAALSLEKYSIVISDGVSAAGFEKRIPGALVRYCFKVDNTGGAVADTIVITDDMTVNGLDNIDLTAGAAGHVVQDIATACDCAAIVETASGDVSVPAAVTISIPTITGTPTPATQRACAYIEGTIK